MKSAVVAIIGRPSSGKSTLLNALCGEKVSIVSPHPQTTRNKIRGIVSRKEGQLVFIDTPGYHISDKKFNQRMKELSVHALSEADLILYVIDASRKPGEEEQTITELVAPQKGKLIVAANKIDAEKKYIEDVRLYIKLNLGVEAFEVSALEGKGVEALICAIMERAEEGELLYPEEFYTDQTPEFRAAEIIREKAVNKVREEVPHSLYVSISDMEVREGEKELWIRAFIYVERESQKGILVGKGASMIRAIRIEAEKELSEILPYRVKLDLSVKVHPKWRSKDKILKGLIN